MDGSYLGAPRAPVHHTAGVQTPHTGAEPQDIPAPRWAPPAYDRHLYGLQRDFSMPPPRGAGFGGPSFPSPYGFDPLVPPPPFSCPPPDHFPPMPPAGPVSGYGSGSTFQAFSPQFRTGPPRYGDEYEPDFSQMRYEDRQEGEVPTGPPDCSTGPHPEDEGDVERRRDKQWLREFLQRTSKTSSPESLQTQPISIPGLREALYGAARLISQLEGVCHSLKPDLDHCEVWEDTIQTAFQVKRQLQDKLSLVSGSVEGLKAKLTRLRQRRARGLRARKQLQLEAERAEERSSEKEAAIDKWRMRRIQQVEEKKKDQELKAAADAVLCEVRRKQADVKRMQDVLRSLEKLRRLRKEAASRKGIVTQQQCDEEFTCRLEQIRCVLKRRTTLYSAEEKALMVMLEGEQEEERRREWEKRVKKERERQLQRRRRVDAMLFGEDPPTAGVLQPFREYYSQAEVSLPALLQIRCVSGVCQQGKSQHLQDCGPRGPELHIPVLWREWDTFLVAADHPDGSRIPPSWILPDSPSDHVWASALQPSDADDRETTQFQRVL